ncbi:MAG: DUF3391 domain-containing protein [Methylophilaceae bacterium]|nr:DUF3391 domain-containing protein [Methylophilaceae bacterium]
MYHDPTKFAQKPVAGHYVTPDQLRVGMYVHLDLGWMEHPFFLNSFKIKSEKQIQQILELNLPRIRFDPARSEVLPDFPSTIRMQKPAATPKSPCPPDEVTIRQSKRLEQLNTAILESERAYAKKAPLVRMAVAALADHPEHSRKLAKHVVREMVDSVFTESDVALHAIGGAQEVYTHPLNVTVLALMLAKSLDMPAEAVFELGLAALLHDAGKETSPIGKSFVDLHCESGARLVLQAGFSERVSKVVMQHHEYADGSGFPMRLKLEQIDLLARILSLVNHFDELCNPANPAEALTPYEALSLMYTKQSQWFDPVLLQMFIRLLGVYPPGSVVQLSNGLYGIVLAENPAQPMCPLVMVYVQGVARATPVVIDLAQEHTLSIQKCLRPGQLPAEAYEYLKPAKRMSFYLLKRMAGQDIQESQDVAYHGEDGSQQLRRRA